MKLIKLTIVLLVGLLFKNGVNAQLSIKPNTTFMIAAGATVTVQNMDVESESNILTNGANTGKLRMQGTATARNINMNGFNVPNLEMDNAVGTIATGNARVTENLNFVNGHLTLNTFNFRIDHDATITNNTAARHVKTPSTGELIKEVSANLNAYEMPVGMDNAYNPLALTTTGGPYNPNGTVFVGVRDTLQIHHKKHPAIPNFLLNYWPITQALIPDGNLSAKAIYNEVGPDQVNGDENKFAAYYWRDDIQAWSTNGANITPAINTTGNILNGNGDLYAMDTFGLVAAKVFLQGAYDPVTHLMRDQLRTPAPNVIPTNDPYRVAPLNAAFTHVNNPVPEQAAGTVFMDQAAIDNNITDWVFLELRSGADGKTKLATRSALVQRDGDIVDIDGVSPVTFVGVPPADNAYTLAVRHRNHLGISTEPTTNLLTVNPTTTTLVDFTTLTDAQIFGPAVAFKVANDGRNNLWGGNANFNNNTRFNGLANDKDFILLNTLGGNPAASIINTYHTSDVNMNKVVRFNGLQNDKDFILLTVLSGNPAASVIQFLP